MPVTVSYPGVYIDEVSSGVHTITSVSTSIAAFFGRTSKGKLNLAIRCLSPADFTRNFGAPHPQSDLAHAVRQFFANGGTDCYVVRLANGAKSATVTLRGLSTGAQSVLIATAKAEGLWGNGLRLRVDYNTTSPHESFNLRVIQEEAGVEVASETHLNLSMDPASPRFAPSFVSQSSSLIDLALPPGLLATMGTNFQWAGGYSQSRRPITAPAGTFTQFAVALNAMIAANQNAFVIRINDGPPRNVVIPLQPAAPASFAAVGAQLTADIAPFLAGDSVVVTAEVVAGMGPLLHFVSNGGSQTSVKISRASNNDIAAALMLGVEQGGLEQARYSNFRPAPNATLLTIGGATAPFPLAGLPGQLTGTVNAFAIQAQNIITQIVLDGVVVKLNDPAHMLQTRGAADPWFLNKVGASAITGDNDGLREKLQIIAGAINAEPLVNYTAEVWGYQLALLSKGPGINTLPATFTTTPVVASIPAAFTPNTRWYSLGLAGSSAFSTAGVPGDDGVAPTTGDYFGSAVAQTGFHALDPVDLFNLMVIPPDEGVLAPDHLKLWGPASVYCAEHRAFLLVDAPPTWTGADGRPAVVGNVSTFLSALNVSVKTHSAVFYPRLVFDDRGLKRMTGPGGAIAGLMARTDATRGVWKAPAGVEADVRDVLGVEVKLTDAENGVLNKKAVNCIRVFPGGLVNWGARTMAGDDDTGSEWKYIPIRRLALNIEESLFRGTKWVVFEPNDEPLWAKIRLNINAYMMSLFRQGAFQGTSPKEAFFVKCDKDTTTQDDRNKGIVNIEVGFAPLKPAEFVVIKIQQIAGDL
jgi:uncharacterized protein